MYWHIKTCTANGHWAPDTWYWALSTGYWALDTGNWALSTGPGNCVAIVLMAGRRPAKKLPLHCHRLKKCKLCCHCIDGGPKARQKNCHYIAIGSKYVILCCHCIDGGPKARKKIVLISRLATGHIAHLCRSPRGHPPTSGSAT
jgi:hypothetical protein